MKKKKKMKTLRLGTSHDCLHNLSRLILQQIQKKQASFVSDTMTVLSSPLYPYKNVLKLRIREIQLFYRLTS